MVTILDKPRDTGQYLINGAYTFRLSCRKILSNDLDTPYNNFGGNRQNLEKGMRKVWIADKGYTFLQCDQSGADALIVAHLCKSAKYRSLFIYGIKPHVYMALKLFPAVWVKHFGADKIAQALLTPIPELKSLPFWKELETLIKSSDNWSANERYYFFAKKVIHSSSYGMRENTFRMDLLKESGGTISISHKDATNYLIKFHQEFPEIREWHNRLFREAQKNKVIRNLFGHPYYITKFFNEDNFKDIIAWAPQSTVADINRQAFIRLQEHIEKENKNWHILADTHDSIMQEVPDNDVMEGAKLMKSLVEIELTSPVDGVKFRMKSEVQYGKNWSSYKENKNENGLKELSC